MLLCNKQFTGVNSIDFGISNYAVESTLSKEPIDPILYQAQLGFVPVTLVVLNSNGQRWLHFVSND